MISNRWCLVALVSLAPIGIEVQSGGDTLATATRTDGTRFEVLAGTGEYAFISRGCEGTVLSLRKISFRDVGVAIEQDVGSNGASLGVRGGWTRDDMAGSGQGSNNPYNQDPGYPRAVIENHYVNPYVTLERPRGSIGLGWVLHEREFITADEGARAQASHPLNDLSGHIRIGSRRRYFAVRWMEGVPLYASGGYLTIGMGGHPAGGPVQLYGGLAAGGPYEGAGIAIQGAYEFRSGLAANVRARLGTSGGANASGVAAGFGYGTTRP